MPTFYMLSANEMSTFRFTMANEGVINAALDRVNMQGRSYTNAGSWYSPTRIDRANPLLGQTSTKVQRVLAINDGIADPRAKAVEIGNNMKQALDHAGDDLAGMNYQQWTGVSVTPFSEAQHGSLSGWHDGSLTRSATADQPTNWYSDFIPNTSAAKVLATIAALGVGTFLLWPVLMKARASSAQRSPELTRRNPRRRR